jgi:hypothetical protein
MNTDDPKIRKLHRETIQTLKAMQSSDDTESAHADADDALCQLLGALGFKDVVTEYHKVPKWFA